MKKSSGLGINYSTDLFKKEPLKELLPFYRTPSQGIVSKSFSTYL
jgi:hypothetical protein